MKDLVEVIMEIWESVRWEDGGCNDIIIDNVIFSKEYKGNRFVFTLRDLDSGTIKGYIESDGTTYFNVIGVEEWEKFIDIMGW